MSVVRLRSPRLVLCLAAILHFAACGRGTRAPGEAGAAADVPSWAKVAPEQIEAARKAGVPVAFENSIGMRFVLIPAGTFTMGSPVTEAGRDGDETQHEVTLTKPYYLGITEVTNAQYRRFKANHDSGEYQGVSLNGDEQPVEQVSWHDAVAFTEWLSGQDRGRTYRLPTEAEWERACRAGTAGRWFWGEDEAATGRYANVADRAMKARWGRAIMQFWPESLGPWFIETDDGEEVAASVAKHLPNAYGLYDMVGNVCELCEDWYAEYPIGAASDPMGASGSRFGLRVFRGGSWHGPAGEDRAAARGRRTPDYPYGAVGFRLAAGVTVAGR